MISVDEALAIVLQRARKKKSILRPFNLCEGYILAEKIISHETIPPYDNSAVDGFAIRVEDAEKSNSFKIVGTLHAGEIFLGALRRGEAVHIMTGAPLPKGANAVVKIEDTHRENAQVKISSKIKRLENIRKAGDDINKGDKVFDKGRRLSAFDIGVLASLGKTKVRVIPKPTVAIISTGDELVMPHEKRSRGQIRASSSSVLTALAERLGATVHNLGIARDNKKILTKMIQQAFSADIILTTGGVSMGEHDYVREIFKTVGIKIDFWKVKQKPGKPLVFGHCKDKLFFGLPGNPVSSIVCFILYVYPTITKMAGELEFPPRMEVQLAHSISKKAGLRQFLRATLNHENGKWLASLTGEQSSGMLTSLSNADVVLDLPEDTGNLNVGERAMGILLKGI